MSTRKGAGSTRTRKPKHQNTFAFRHNPKSQKTAKILGSVNAGLCASCHDKVEWRKRYRKYRPLRQPATCNDCHKKTITAAYHKICAPCARERRVCPWCCTKGRPRETSEDGGEGVGEEGEGGEGADAEEGDGGGEGNGASGGGGKGMAEADDEFMQQEEEEEEEEEYKDGGGGARAAGGAGGGTRVGFASGVVDGVKKSGGGSGKPVGGESGGGSGDTMDDDDAA